MYGYGLDVGQLYFKLYEKIGLVQATFMALRGLFYQFFSCANTDGSFVNTLLQVHI